MKHLYILLIALFVAGCAPNYADQVKKCYTDYKNALLATNGGRAVQFIDSNTLAYYEKMVHYTKNVTALQIDDLPLLDQLVVISLRHRATHSEIQSFDGRSLFMWAINNGMVGKRSVENTDITDIVIKNDIATAECLINNRKVLKRFTFRKEDGNWKIDLTSVFPETEHELVMYCRRNNLNTRNFISEMIEKTSGTPIDMDIWNKMPVESPAP